MGLITAVAGTYTGAWNSGSVGQSQDGFRVRSSINKEVVRVDAYGDSVIDGVWRGGDVFTLFVSSEFLAGLPAWWPYGSAFGVLGQVGRMDVQSSLAQILVLTAASGTPAAVLDAIATLTAGNAILDENFNAETALRSGLRMLPISMRMYPYVSSGTRFFATT